MIRHALPRILSIDENAEIVRLTLDNGAVIEVARAPIATAPITQSAAASMHGVYNRRMVPHLMDKHGVRLTCGHYVEDGASDFLRCEFCELQDTAVRQQAESATLKARR